METTDEDIDRVLRKQWGKGYTFKIIEVIRRKSFGIIVLYRVKCHRDGCIEWRCKGWGGNVGWEYVTRRKF